MKKVISILCFVFACTLAFAQSAKYEEVVYLKNGSVIHGMIVEFVPNVSIKIKSGANLFVYKFEEIEKVTREELKGDAAAEAGGFQTKAKGYYGIAQVGLSDFPAGGNLPMASLAIINGYQFNRIFSMGLGVGADISRVNTYNIPIFMDMRVNFLKKRVTPFFAVGVGYNMQLTQISSGYYGGSSNYIFHGMVFNPQFGVKASINKKVGVSLALGYKLIGVKYSYSTYYGYNTVDNFGLSHGVSLMAGVHF
ncbi:MAG: hypothetical protein JWO03_1631 [Bacteroidetes bacterium]|nr:hypothetical protein [Bacteroidota bacterium]